jgi:hypothetical protein
LLRLLGTLGQVFTENLKYPIVIKRLLKMKKYNEEYFSVIETKTGRKIVDCGEEEDALAMVSFDPQNRTYARNKFLMGPVVDIEIPKQLPTSNVAVTNTKGNECAPIKEQLPDAGPLRLKEDSRIPVNAK